MPRGLNNWNFNDVVRFLRDYGFRQNYTEGSHFYYTGSYSQKFRQVCVPFHGKKSIKPRTLKSIITQSGIPQKEWVDGNK